MLVIACLSCGPDGFASSYQLKTDATAAGGAAAGKMTADQAFAWHLADLSSDSNSRGSWARTSQACHCLRGKVEGGEPRMHKLISGHAGLSGMELPFP